MVSILLALGCQLKWATGPGPRYDHRHGTCHAWHARHWRNSRICRWAWPPDVGGQCRPSRALRRHALPCVMEHSKSIEHSSGFETFAGMRHSF